MSEALAQLERVRPGGVWEIVKDAVLNQNIWAFCYHHRPLFPAEVMNCGETQFEVGVPKQLSEYRSARLNEDDPILVRALTSFSPFLWSEVFSDANLTRNQRRFITASQRLGLTDGFAVPMHGPFGQSGYCGFAVHGDARLIMDVELRRVRELCFKAHEIFCESRFKKPRSAALSPRQFEAMTLLVQGQSIDEISARMNVTENTTRTNLGRAFVKLDAEDKITAVLKFLAYGRY